MSRPSVTEDSIPVEVWTRIFYLLSATDIGIAALTCSRFRDAALDRGLWMEMVFCDDIPLDLEYGLEWRRLYRHVAIRRVTNPPTYICIWLLSKTVMHVHPDGRDRYPDIIFIEELVVHALLYAFLNWLTARFVGIIFSTPAWMEYAYLPIQIVILSCSYVVRKLATQLQFRNLRKNFRVCHDLLPVITRVYPVMILTMQIVAFARGWSL